MSLAYVYGPISFHGEHHLPAYKAAMEVCRRHYSDVIGSWPTFWDHTGESPRDYYQRIRRTILRADLFVGEFTHPSHGVGMETQMACDAGISLIGMAETGTRISPMILGLDNFRGLIEYSSLAQLAEQLEAEIIRLKDGGL